MILSQSLPAFASPELIPSYQGICFDRIFVEAFCSIPGRFCATKLPNVHEGSTFWGVVLFQIRYRVFLTQSEDPRD